jgi:hypothetical protein
MGWTNQLTCPNCAEANVIWTERIARASNFISAVPGAVHYMQFFFTAFRRSDLLPYVWLNVKQQVPTFTEPRDPFPMPALDPPQAPPKAGTITVTVPKYRCHMCDNQFIRSKLIMIKPWYTTFVNARFNLPDTIQKHGFRFHAECFIPFKEVVCYIRGACLLVTERSCRGRITSSVIPSRAVRC